MIHFSNPIIFLLIPPVILLFFLLRRLRKYHAISVSNISIIKKSAKKTGFTKIALLSLNIAVILLLVLIAARPQGLGGIKEEKFTGMDMVIAMDISGSMRAEDFNPNRIEAAKRITLNFIDRMKGNRIGLVLFAGRSFTQSPLTVDYNVLTEFINRIDLRMIDISGTAIGDAIVTSANRFFDDKVRSRVIVLLTDGENNGGAIDPLTSAAVAKYRGIKVYTIGIGSPEGAPIPVYSESGKVIGTILAKIDEPLLTDIADITGGRYISASDEKGLISAFGQIADMEKDNIKMDKHVIYKDYYPHAAVAVAFIFTLSFLYERLRRRTASLLVWRNQIYKWILSGVFILVLLFIAIGPDRKNNEGKGDGLDIVIAMDTSLSMQTEDIAPNRGVYANNLAREIITALPAKRVGIVLFSDYGYILCPLTYDRDAALTLLSNRTRESGKGTNISDAIMTSALLFTDKDHKKVILLLTDGEDTRGVKAEKIGEILQDNNIRLFTIGIGRKEGGLIPIRTGEKMEFKKDIAGEYVHSRLDEGLLMEIAKAGKGEYISMGNNPVEIIKAGVEGQGAGVRDWKGGASQYLSFVALMLFMVIIIL